VPENYPKIGWLQALFLHDTGKNNIDCRKPIKKTWLSKHRNGTPIRWKIVEKAVDGLITLKLAMYV
jgi:hypothetical protein